MVAKFNIGQAVNAKFGKTFQRITVNGKRVLQVFHVEKTWYTTQNGRQYQLRESDQIFNESDLKAA